MNLPNSLFTNSIVVLFTTLSLLSSGQVIAGKKNKNQASDQLSSNLRTLLDTSSSEGGDAYLLPDSADYDAIPRDPKNLITPAKVALGKLLFHETGVGTEAGSPDRIETYSCATCHHAAAGFKSGIVQGIGDGGSGFKQNGKQRRLASGMDPDAADNDPLKPDVQPVTSPTILNAAFQRVMLWDGSLGNPDNGLNVSAANLKQVGPAGVKVNEFGLDGLETQVLAGTKVHRLRFDNNSILQTIEQYKDLYDVAFPGGDTGIIPPGSIVSQEALGAAKAIAAYERTVLANKAPFQLWLRGNENAMTEAELRGAILFFGDAKCVSCHRGPALSSESNALAGEMFFNVGFDDFEDKKIAGVVPDPVKLGRGNFTGDASDNFKFKVPPLYNLKDARVLGHGASFKSVKQVINYKNKAIPQKSNTQNLASEFQPLNLTQKEIKDLTTFINDALYDPDLARYQPKQVPSGNCFPAADFQSAINLKCW